MAKLGIHDLRDEHKPAGDAFEMIVAGYFEEQGFQAVRDWVSKYYQPLIYVAKTACEDFKYVRYQFLKLTHHSTIFSGITTARSVNGTTTKTIAVLSSPVQRNVLASSQVGVDHLDREQAAYHPPTI